jgi:hypothetical protein
MSENMSDERQFPILVPRDAKGREINGCPTSVPWSMVEPEVAADGPSARGAVAR